MNTKIQNCLILLFLIPSFCLAQNEEEKGIFAFANNTNGSSFSRMFETQDYKYRVAKKVLDDLILAKGDLRQKAPDFEMSDAKRKVAFANLNKGIIGLEEKGYDVCISFGKDSLNALAALLSHELIHYYDKHDWEGRQREELEEQADYLGGFLAFTAGYNTLGMMPQFLEKTYEAYGLPAEMRGYPSLTERQKLASASLEKLRQLIGIFETANYLVLLEDYESARLYYEYILQEEFQSREIYNNLGVTVVLEGMEYFSNEELKFAFPLELDASSRLAMGGLRNLGAGEDRKAIFKKAISYFEQAKTLDPDYATAWLNIAIAYTLMEELFDAEYFVRKAMQISQNKNDSKVQGDIFALWGIIAAIQGNEAEAKNHFESGVALNNAFAKINLEILNGSYEAAVKRAGLPNNQEKIDDINLNLVVNKLMMSELEVDEQIELNRKTYFLEKKHPASAILINFFPYEMDPAYNIFQITRLDYTGQTLKGIRIGSSKTEVLNSYGVPYKTIQNTTGEFLIYRNKNIGFEMDVGNRVKRWFVFRIEKRKMTN